MADEKYLYEVHPVRPVISPIEGRLVRRPFSCELTISQLGEIMGKARVFRRFPDLTELVPVTGATVHELHRARFSDPIPEVAFKEKERANAELVDVNRNEPVTAPVVEEKPVVVEEPTVEEVIAPEPEKVEEAPVEETEQKTEETAEIATSEEVSVEEQGKQENNTDLEVEASQDAEKEVSESKAITTIVIPSQDNANKFHDKKKDKKHNKEN